MEQTINQCIVIGNPISHSKSPEIHHQFAKEMHILVHYQRVLSPINALKSTLDEWMAKDIVGANITLPFKEEVLPYCDSLTEEARYAQAVNTLAFRDGKVYGHNTDGLGLIFDIEQNIGYSIANKRLLLLGAGGAARGILLPLLQAKPEKITITNRTLERTEPLVETFQSLGNLEAQPWNEIEEPYDLIINATSASLQGIFPAFNKKIIKTETVGYDLMYADQPTVFMDMIIRNGGKAAYDGLGMLVEQAKFAFEFWFNMVPPTHSVYQLLRNRS